jgi:N-acetylmuramoyl-L-alanine amidase
MFAGLAAGLFVGCATPRPSPSPAAPASQPGELSLQIMDPRSATVSTTRGFVNVLGRTSPDAKVSVGGEPAQVFATGIFVRDQVPLELGENQITIVATARDGQRLERVVTVNRLPEPVVAPRPPRQGIEPDTDSHEAAGKEKAGFWDETTLRFARVKEDGAALSFGVHEVRLGGPYLAELPAGTLLRVTGMRGGNYRVRLSPALDGWVASRDVEWAPPETVLPHLAFTSLSAYGDASTDHVSIPYAAPVPFSVTPTQSPGGRAAIEIDFFGAHHAATWISHRLTAKAVREVTMHQVATDHLRVCVELHARQLWGYQWNVTNNTFRLSVRRPPTLPSPPASPLRGLSIALEAGHGGPNSGARGVSGSLEKDINRMAVEELARQFQAVGVRTVLVRENDENPTLGERTRRAVLSNADLFISVHANSAGNERGYLRVSGTSTYYKWSFSRDLSAAIHARLLAHTGLDDFGNVGNFNYYPIRANTWMPSMLVEQAFMSNPEDEAKMLNPVFRKEMMRAVVLGAEDWLKEMRAGLGR